MKDVGIGDIVKQLRKEKGWSQVQLAKASGLSQVTISDIERGRNRSSRDLPSLASALDTTVEHLTKRRHGVRSLTGSAGSTDIDPTKRQTDAVNVVSVSLLDVGAGMGDGRVATDRDIVIGNIDLPVTWVRTYVPEVTSPRNLRLITGYGDSMEDTYRDGDMLLVDTGITDIKLDAVYVFRLESELFVKRIQRLPGQVLRVISDNRARYEPYDLHERERAKMRVLGRVVWAWNGKRL